MRSGGSYVQSFDALRLLQEHARGELEMLITTGQRGSSTALPLTDAQRKRRDTDAKAAKAAVAAAAAVAHPQDALAAAAAVKPAEGGGAHGTTARPGQRSPRRITSTALNPDRPLCHRWAKGCCKLGHTCSFQHPSVTSHTPNGQVNKK